MNTETQKLLAQLLLQGKMYPETEMRSDYTFPIPLQGGDIDRLQNDGQLEQLLQNVRLAPRADGPNLPQDPMTLGFLPQRQPDGSTGRVGWRDEPVGSPAPFPAHREARPSAVGMAPSPGMMPQGPSAPLPMMNPNPMAQPSYRPPVDGSVPPLDPDLMRDALRGTYDDASRFDDARAVQTADAGGMVPLTTRGEDGKVGSTASNRIETGELAERTSLARLDNIMSMLEENPDLLDATATMQGNLKSRVLGLKDRFGFELSPEQEAYLGDSAAFRQTVLMNVNDYIKEITGAQVGQGQETQRLMGALPNLGDSPTEFRSKLANAISLTRLQVARYNYMRREGTDDRPSDRELTRILRDRGAELYREALDGGLSPSEARVRAAGMLSQEFGI